MNAQECEQIKNDPLIQSGISVYTPNTTKEKVEAILNLSIAIRALAEAIKSTNIKVDISDCHINNGGITIQTE